MMKTMVMTLTIGSTTNCLTRTNVPTSTVFTVVVSTVPIIVRFGTFMTRRTDISRPRNTTIIQGRVIMAMAIGISLLATSANAHPKLTYASPAADVSSKVSPTEIKLNFSEGVIAKFSGVEIKNESGKTIPTGVPVTDPKDQKQLVVPLPTPLTAGHYTVTWHAF